MKSYKKTLLLFLLFSCDPEVFTPVVKNDSAIEKKEFAYDKVVINPIYFNFQDAQFKKQINKIILKNINNYTDLKILFGNVSAKKFTSKEAFTLDVKVYQIIGSEVKYNLEFRVFENKNETLVFKKVLKMVKNRNVVRESEKSLRDIFKHELRKHRPLERLTSVID